MKNACSMMNRDRSVSSAWGEQRGLQTESARCSDGLGENHAKKTLAMMGFDWEQTIVHHDEEWENAKGQEDSTQRKKLVFCVESGIHSPVITGVRLVRHETFTTTSVPDSPKSSHVFLM